MIAMDKTANEYWLSFIEQSPLAIAIFDRQMRYIAASKRWMSDYNLGNRKLAGLSHYEVFPEIPERWREFHQRGLEGEAISMPDDKFIRLDGTVLWLRWEIQPWYRDNEIGGIILFVEDVTVQKRALEDLHRLNSELEMRVHERTQALEVSVEKLKAALLKVRQLSQLLPICAACKKIRDDQGQWHQVEVYIRDHAGVEFSHGICPECTKKLYPDMDI